MAVQNAKEAFSKGDIIDILKQNVSLYKNEPEFVDYIVNLALYLIDQAYVMSGERSSDLESVLEFYEKSRIARGSEGLPMPPARPPRLEEEALFPSMDSSIEEEVSASSQPFGDEPPTVKGPLKDEDGEPATNKFYAKGFQPTLRKGEGDEDEPAADASKAPPQGPEAFDPFDRSSASGEIRKEDPPTTRRVVVDRRSLMAPGAYTPEPEGGLVKDRGGSAEERVTDKINPDLDADPPTRKLSPQIQVDQQGKARIYKVVRSYSAREGGKLICPICGTDTKSQPTCPNCGHML
ncbi:MAG: hypothetical protein RLY93_17110 [Sumerlaeia bacterium]